MFTNIVWNKQLPPSPFQVDSSAEELAWRRSVDGEVLDCPAYSLES
jgi:hypothetical protein